MNQPLISVIIPVYNHEKWIGRCLRSLLNQTMRKEDYELIVINDGSQDKSNYALQIFYQDIILINNKKNNGLPSALNEGIRKSRGNYIVRVDSDDYVNEHFLSFLCESLEQNKYMDAISCDYFLVDDNEEIIERMNCESSPIGCGIMFKSSHLFEIGLFDENFKLHEEAELRYRFEKKYKISRLEIPLYRYRRHETNITNDKEKLTHHQNKMKRKHNL